jgi:hypothetical protein
MWMSDTFFRSREGRVEDSLINPLLGKGQAAPVTGLPADAIPYLYGRVTFEELPESFEGYDGVETDIEEFVSVADNVHELIGRIRFEHDITSSYTWNNASTFDLTCFHESLNHLAGKFS